MLFPVLSLSPHRLQNHQITQGSAPATDSNADCCPDAWRSLSLACIQRSRLFNYFCSISLIFLSLLGDKQAGPPSLSQVPCSTHDHFHPSHDRNKGIPSCSTRQSPLARPNTRTASAHVAPHACTWYPRASRHIHTLRGAFWPYNHAYSLTIQKGLEGHCKAAQACAWPE